VSSDGGKEGSKEAKPKAMACHMERGVLLCQACISLPGESHETTRQTFIPDC
jgi:hypothetical protein